MLVGISSQACCYYSLYYFAVSSDYQSINFRGVSLYCASAILFIVYLILSFANLGGLPLDNLGGCKPKQEK